MIYCFILRSWYGCREYSQICGTNKRDGATFWLSVFFTLKLNFTMLYYLVMVKSSVRYASRWTYLSIAVLIQITLITIIHLQRDYGSKFFLPHCLRKYKHNYLKFIENEYLAVDIVSGNLPFCELWLGSLNTDGMLDIESNNEEYNRLKQNIGLYAETPCEHKFHYACLYSYLIDHDSCPKCSSNIPKINEYDD